MEDIKRLQLRREVGLQNDPQGRAGAHKGLPVLNMQARGLREVSADSTRRIPILSTGSGKEHEGVKDMIVTSMDGFLVNLRNAAAVVVGEGVVNERTQYAVIAQYVGLPGIVLKTFEDRTEALALVKALGQLIGARTLEEVLAVNPQVTDCNNL